MGWSLFKLRLRGEKSPMAFCVPTLALLLPAQSFAATAASQLPVVAAATTSQAGSQGQASSTNSMASMLGQAAGVLSMAAGGLYMAKGVQQMKCCTQGCTGSGTASKDEAAKEAAKAKDAASTIQRQPIDYFKLRFPDEANKSCPAVPVRNLRAFSLLELFQPQKAVADMSGCLDAGIALATGGLMLLNGMLGLAAASQSSQMANTTGANASGMDTIGNSVGTSPTPDSTSTASLGNSTGSSNPIKLDPALLRTGKANDIMNQFENQFGIPRDQFANGVIGGQDPRNMLNSAPQNALSNDDMNKALRGAKAMSDSEKAAALANSPIGAAQRELASKMGAGDAQYEVKMAGASTAGSGLAAFGAKKDSEPDAADLSATEAAVPGVSPEVQAALAAKEIADRQAGLTEQTIFEVVHAKYREKSKMIFGFNPDGLPKGNGHGI